MVETSEYAAGNIPNMTNNQETMTGSVVQGEKPKGNIAETAVDETNECVSEVRINSKTKILAIMQSLFRVQIKISDLIIHHLSLL